ncbi:hypothetical protein H6H02_22420 [Coleofasciculus sp. FACHB-1120]|nr:hypothetical protein [Coleofasciculus sp. FACHB-1120]
MTSAETPFAVGFTLPDHTQLPDSDGTFVKNFPLGVELGIWQGRYTNMEFPWLRWWDAQGNLLLDGTEAQIAEDRAQLAEDRAERLAERLKAMGVNPDDLT